MLDSEQRLRRWLANLVTNPDRYGDISPVVRAVAHEAVAGRAGFVSDSAMTRAAMIQARIEHRRWERERQCQRATYPNDSKCTTCGHLGSLHEDLEGGQNDGPCSTPSCPCPGMTAPTSGTGSVTISKPSFKRLPTSSKASGNRKRSRGGTCPGCGHRASDLKVNSAGTSKFWHRSCFESSRARGDRSPSAAGLRKTVR